jgi:hypothetical protein
MFLKNCKLPLIQQFAVQRKKKERKSEYFYYIRCIPEPEIKDSDSNFKFNVLQRTLNRITVTYSNGSESAVSFESFNSSSSSVADPDPVIFNPWFRDPDPGSGLGKK